MGGGITSRFQSKHEHSSGRSCCLGRSCTSDHHLSIYSNFDCQSKDKLIGPWGVVPQILVTRLHETEGFDEGQTANNHQNTTYLSTCWREGQCWAFNKYINMRISKYQKRKILHKDLVRNGLHVVIDISNRRRYKRPPFPYDANNTCEKSKRSAVIMQSRNC